MAKLNAAHEINRAHAFLFRNRLREARALHLENKGKLLNGTPLEQVIADDFGALRRAGLTHQMMREVEVALGIAPAQVSRSAAADAHRAVLVGDGGAPPPPAPPMSSTYALMQRRELQLQIGVPMFGAGRVPQSAVACMRCAYTFSA